MSRQTTIHPYPIRRTDRGRYESQVTSSRGSRLATPAHTCSAPGAFNEQTSSGPPLVALLRSKAARHSLVGRFRILRDALQDRAQVAPCFSPFSSRSERQSREIVPRAVRRVERRRRSYAERDILPRQMWSTRGSLEFTITFVILVDRETVVNFSTSCVGQVIKLRMKREFRRDINDLLIIALFARPAKRILQYCINICKCRLLHFTREWRLNRLFTHGKFRRRAWRIELPAKGNGVARWRQASHSSRAKSRHLHSNAARRERVAKRVGFSRSSFN